MLGANQVTKMHKPVHFSDYKKKQNTRIESGRASIKWIERTGKVSRKVSILASTLASCAASSALWFDKKQSNETA